MVNTSVVNINSTSDPFSFKVCFNGTHAGTVVAFLAFSLCFILGTPAHSWLLWLYLRAGWKIKPTQVFPLNQTILELIFCIQCAVEILNSLIFNDDTLWVVIFTFVTLCLIGRPLVQVCICIEQYLAVIYPIMFLRYKGIQYRISCAAVVWMILVIFTACEMNVYFLAVYINNSVFFIAVIIISFCCVSVLHALKHPAPGDSQIPAEHNRDVGNQQKRNAFNMILSGLLITLCTYLPQVSLSFINIMQIDLELFICNIAPIINSFNIVGMLITLVQKMHKNTKYLKTSN